MMEHQDIFEQPVDDMVKKRSPQYLQAWTNMFYALVLLSDKERRSGDPGETVEEGSVDTFDPCWDDGDYDEYLVDATDGMEREWDVGAQGAELTPPSQTRVRNPYIKHKGDHVWRGG